MFRCSVYPVAAVWILVWRSHTRRWSGLGLLILPPISISMKTTAFPARASGFPTIQRKVFDAQTARNAYLLITAGGRRVELRQVGTSNIYDATDSSYLRLTDNGGTLLVHSTDGTRLSFSEINGEYRCVRASGECRHGDYVDLQSRRFC